MGTVKVVVDVEAVAALAETRLAQVLPRRWRHVRAVAQRARSVATTLSLPDDLLAAAWLHDIGYAPELAETGFHPLDGARFLRRAGVDGQVVSLVAYHSCAQIEADVRGLGAELAAEFTPADALLSDALLYCDMRLRDGGQVGGGQAHPLQQHQRRLHHRLPGGLRVHRGHGRLPSPGTGAWARSAWSTTASEYAVSWSSPGEAASST